MENSCCFDDVLFVGDALDFFVFAKNFGNLGLNFQVSWLISLKQMGLRTITPGRRPFRFLELGFGETRHSKC